MQELLRVLSLADEGDTIIRNIGTHSLNYTASHSQDSKPEQHLHDNLKPRKINFKLKVDFGITPLLTH
jgi:hypothetical protein